jgi:hypothetical protein
LKQESEERELVGCSEQNGNSVNHWKQNRGEAI